METTIKKNTSGCRTALRILGILRDHMAMKLKEALPENRGNTTQKNAKNMPKITGGSRVPYFWTSPKQKLQVDRSTRYYPPNSP